MARENRVGPRVLVDRRGERRCTAGGARRKEVYSRGRHREEGRVLQEWAQGVRTCTARVGTGSKDVYCGRDREQGRTQREGQGRRTCVARGGRERGRGPAGMCGNPEEGDAGGGGDLERGGEEEADVGAGGRVGRASLEEGRQQAERVPGHRGRRGGLLAQHPQGPGTHRPRHPLKPCSYQDSVSAPHTPKLVGKMQRKLGIQRIPALPCAKIYGS